MKRCYLVRHAQTAWNWENRLQGRSDLPLDAGGLAQAGRVGAYFAGCPLQALFTSGLQRSQQTAAAIIQGNGHRLQPVIEEDLAEMHLGVWEGLTPAEIDARFGNAYQQWKRLPSSVAIPQAEPVAEFRARSRQALGRTADSVSDGEFVIVSHGGVIASLLADLLDADYDALLRRLRLDNGGITAVEFGAGAAHVCWINAVGHLDGLALPSSLTSGAAPPLRGGGQGPGPA